MKYLRVLSVLASLIFAGEAVFAKQFSSQYCQFELPSKWECALEGTEWVCQSSNSDRKKEAIIILAAKIRGKQDDLANYQAYLKETKTFQLPGGKTQISEPKYTKKNRVNNHTWIDSLHLASEVPGFYTRYLATVKEDLGVAVTFSVAKDHYNSYQAVFDKVVETLKVFRQKAAIDPNDSILLSEDGDGTLLPDDVIPDSDRRVDIGFRRQKKKSGGDDSSSMIIIIVALGAAGFVLTKLKKKKKKSKKKKK